MGRKGIVTSPNVLYTWPSYPYPRKFQRIYQYFVCLVLEQDSTYFSA